MSRPLASTIYLLRNSSEGKVAPVRGEGQGPATTTITREIVNLARTGGIVEIENIGGITKIGETAENVMTAEIGDLVKIADLVKIEDRVRIADLVRTADHAKIVGLVKIADLVRTADHAKIVGLVKIEDHVRIVTEERGVIAGKAVSDVKAAAMRKIRRTLPMSRSRISVLAKKACISLRRYSSHLFR